MKGRSLISIFLFFILLIPCVSAGVTNGDFETGTLVGWAEGTISGSVTVDAAYANSSNYGVRLNCAEYGEGEAYAEIYQDVDFTGMDNLTLDIYRQNFEEEGTLVVKVGGVNVYTSSSIVQSWVHLDLNVTEYTGTQQLRIFAGGAGPFGAVADVRVDNIGVSAAAGGGESGQHSANVTFNQSFYNDPKIIGVLFNITNMSLTNYEYWVEVIGTNDESIYIGINSEYQEITSSSGQVNITIEKQWLTFPIIIKAELYAYDLRTGVDETLATTPYIIYNAESMAPGSIWTDKSNYNVTELVEISYTTNVAENYIAVEEPYSLWSTHDVLVGTYSFLYELSTSAVGNTTIYLFENSELVDHVTISVSSESGDDAYAAWMKDYYYEGETASFYYYSSNASAQITVYDGADIVVFGPATTQLGYHNGRVNTANTNPGTFLLSLYHNGTYYNDTMIFESADSWVRFDSSKYYVGDTINIEYYLADPTQQISMWDANQKKVVRFTKNYGLVSGSMQTLPYTLSEYNEYSHDIPGRLASGELTLGFWDIFIEDKNGVFIGSWDETYVCEATDDDGSYGFDTSNDMISIFFSPEGIFLLFTAALTMMGLVAAKHPAGGGAGAVVGVGFGVYFKVLPPWMLFLMVIALVVLAGVSVAIHFKGK